MISKKDLSGQSLVEIILALAIFTIVASGLVMFVINSYDLNRRVQESAQALAYTEEGLDALRAIRDQAWNQLQYSTSGLEQNLAGAWQLIGEGTSDTPETGYQREIAIEDVYRDDQGQGEIVETGGVLDPNTKKITSRVAWDIGDHSGQIEAPTYLSNWQSASWQQTDWSGGAGQTVWSDQTRYQTDDGKINNTTPGEVKLSNITAVCDGYNWLFTQATDYSYDSNKIEIIEIGPGIAQLKEQLTPISGSTLNSSFNSGATNWSYYDWEQTWFGNVTGIWNSSGGNPGGWIDIRVSGSIWDRGSGYWQQSFVTTIDNPPVVTVNFNWRVTEFNRLPDSFKIYAFVDSFSGPPILGQEVWSSGEITSTTPWSGLVNIDAHSKVTSARTYYFKLVVRILTDLQWPPEGPYRVGFDNAQVNWSGFSTSYPTDGPTINPVTPYSPTDIDSWTGFSEIANKDGGQIYYQLSNGSNWYYWDGTNWSLAGINNYNLASAIDDHIASFYAATGGTGDLMFKAFLISNGSQLVKLDEINVNCQVSGGAGYQTAGSLESSAYNTGQTSNFQVLNWQESLPTCSPACTVKFQLRAALDNAGLPGSWTDWYGAAGLGSYFTDSVGSMIPTELNGYQWVQYRAELSGDGNNTPVLSDLTIDYH